VNRRREGFRRHDRDRLRAAILDGDALVPLIGSDPQRAGELMRAAVIDPLARSRRSLIDEEGSLHITDAPRWLGPVPERGPFLLFLSLAPQVALDLIIEIVEQATEQWAHVTEPEEREATFEVLVEGTPVELLGDAEVMHWHRGGGHAPSVLTTMLMAVEAWLYRRLDAGEEVEATLARLLESRSVALWGLATEIAAYRPELLQRPLAPLVTGAELLIADRLYRAQPHDHLLIPAIGDHAFGERIRSWNTMEHRQRALIDALMRNVLSGEALVDELTTARARWAERDPDGLKHLLAQTNLKNMQPTELGDGAVMWEYVPPEELRDEVVESSEQLRATGLWLMGPYSSREAIDKGTQLDDAELDQLWALVEGPLAEEFPADLAMGGVRSRADVECGIAATLVLCGESWLARRPDAQAWCREHLLAPFADPPPTHDFDDSGALATDTWDSFCADALPRLWAGAPGDLEIRAAVVRLAVHRHRATVRRLMARVADIPALGADLRRLEHVALVWARWLAYKHERRQREEAARYDWTDAPTVEQLPDVEAPTSEALALFEAGDLSDEPPRLSDWLASTPEGLVRSRRRRHHALSVVDPQHLLAAFEHLLRLPSELPSEERDRRLVFAEDLAGLIAEGMQPDDDGEVGGTPYEHERIALDRLGGLAVAAPIARSANIWRPLLEPGVGAHYWVESFLGAVWRMLRADPSEHAAALLAEMIAFAEQEPNWSRRAAHRTDIALALAGLDRWGGGGDADESTALILAAAREPWVRWVSAELEDSWFAERAVRFLGTPAAEPVLEPVLVRLAELEPHRTVGYRARYDEALGEMLAQLMGRRPEMFTAPDPSGKALRQLLSRLAERGSAVALELVNRLS
jgi:hypothetical protein